MIFVTGAVVIEYVQNPIADAGLINSLGYNLAVVPEEAAEMLNELLREHFTPFAASGDTAHHEIDKLTSDR